MRLKKFFHRLFGAFIKIGRGFFLAAGFLSFLIVFWCFTSGPFWVYHWLGTSKSQTIADPAYIVLLGGGGMPSESGLIRTYYTAKVADLYPDAIIIIALPGNISDTTSSIQQMKKELVLRGIDPARVLFEPEGRNTRAQAMNIRKMLSDINPSVSICLVTAPEHMRRAVLTFRKAGFDNLGAHAAFEQAIEGDITFNDQDLGGRQGPLPAIGKNINLRYRFWTHLRYTELIAKEFIAIGFYWVKGWI